MSENSSNNNGSSSSSNHVKHQPLPVNCAKGDNGATGDHDTITTDQTRHPLTPVNVWSQQFHSAFTLLLQNAALASLIAPDSDAKQPQLSTTQLLFIQSLCQRSLNERTLGSFTEAKTTQEQANDLHVLNDLYEQGMQIGLTSDIGKDLRNLSALITSLTKYIPLVDITNKNHQELLDIYASLLATIVTKAKAIQQQLRVSKPALSTIDVSPEDLLCKAEILARSFPRFYSLVASHLSHEPILPCHGTTSSLVDVAAVHQSTPASSFRLSSSSGSTINAAHSPIGLSYSFGTPGAKASPVGAASSGMLSQSSSSSTNAVCRSCSNPVTGAKSAPVNHNSISPLCNDGGYLSVTSSNDVVPSVGNAPSTPLNTTPVTFSPKRLSALKSGSTPSSSLLRKTVSSQSPYTASPSVSFAPVAVNSSATESNGGRNVFVEKGSGMREVPVWLKNLRLHKYVDLFQEMSYEEMLALNEEWLTSKGVVKGATRKILINIDKLNSRQADLRAMESSLLNLLADLNQPTRNASTRFDAILDEDQRPKKVIISKLSKTNCSDKQPEGATSESADATTSKSTVTDDDDDAFIVVLPPTTNNNDSSPSPVLSSGNEDDKYDDGEAAQTLTSSTPVPVTGSTVRKNPLTATLSAPPAPLSSSDVSPQRRLNLTTGKAASGGDPLLEAMKQISEMLTTPLKPYQRPDVANLTAEQLAAPIVERAVLTSRVPDTIPDGDIASQITRVMGVVKKIIIAASPTNRAAECYERFPRLCEKCCQNEVFRDEHKQLMSEWKREAFKTCALNKPPPSMTPSMNSVHRPSHRSVSGYGGSGLHSASVSSFGALPTFPTSPHFQQQAAALNNAAAANFLFAANILRQQQQQHQAVLNAALGPSLLGRQASIDATTQLLAFQHQQQQQVFNTTAAGATLNPAGRSSTSSFSPHVAPPGLMPMPSAPVTASAPLMVVTSASASKIQMAGATGPKQQTLALSRSNPPPNTLGLSSPSITTQATASEKQTVTDGSSTTSHRHHHHNQPPGIEEMCNQMTDSLLKDDSPSQP